MFLAVVMACCCLSVNCREISSTRCCARLGRVLTSWAASRALSNLWLAVAVRFCGSCATLRDTVCACSTASPVFLMAFLGRSMTACTAACASACAWRCALMMFEGRSMIDCTDSCTFCCFLSKSAAMRFGSAVKLAPVSSTDAQKPSTACWSWPGRLLTSSTAFIKISPCMASMRPAMDSGSGVSSGVPSAEEPAMEERRFGCGVTFADAPPGAAKACSRTFDRASPSAAVARLPCAGVAGTE
mmetsp:Transcript_19568/g.50105  ORF Transcript_19568/g.50105 Transcript_19568/m.50105 type:complete len:243 (+) Transcript_19568:1121-1849(+)